MRLLFLDFIGNLVYYIHTKYGKRRLNYDRKNLLQYGRFISNLTHWKKQIVRISQQTGFPKNRCGKTHLGAQIAV